MVFSSPIFLFFFLPIVLSCYFFVPGIRLKNLWLLLASILFYAWGEVTFVSLMLASTLANYFLGLWVDGKASTGGRKWAVAITIVFNIGILAFFKYANFLVDNFNHLLSALGLAAIHLNPVRLPIGISFFTFHALSYVIDIYRRKCPAARNPAAVGLYIFFFPQLIAGPILRWNSMAPQIARRIVTREGFAEGIRRFIYGLAKKMLIANTLAVPVGQIFSLSQVGVSPVLAWLGAGFYALQIYFDFSGYSDMAVGLGRMFGFEFLENFNQPYISQSVRDFWRRWHISLSTWFRDYVYYPLGGNRGSKSRTCANLVLVFFLCGLWHGASWTFVIWGLFHGFFLALERTRFGAWLAAWPQVFRHGYALLVVLFGWVLFRADTLPQAAAYLAAMFGVGSASSPENLLNLILTRQVIVAALAGILLSMPTGAWLNRELTKLLPQPLWQLARLAHAVILPAVLILIFIVSAAWLAGDTYNPFIYFRF